MATRLETIAKQKGLKNFEDFSEKLEGLSSLYHIHGDRPVVNTSPRIDVILHGRVVNLVPRREGNPMSIEYFITPYDQLEEQMMPGLSCYGNKVLVTVDGTIILHKLPVASLIEDSQQVEKERVAVLENPDPILRDMQAQTISQATEFGIINSPE